MIAVVAGSVLSGSVLAECPSTLPVEELEYCIACEGAGMSYEECKSEAAQESSTSEQKVSDTGAMDLSAIELQ
jgi:hypothetical protein